MFNLFGKKKGHVAHMGDDNAFYFNEELGRWVERGKEHEAEQESLPPPPPASTSAAATHKVLDPADPASRYVSFGFAGAATPKDAVKSFATPPRLTPTPPLTGGFFVPPNVQTTSEATEQMPQQECEKYKGFRIPKFEKPEGVEGSQEEYEAAEIRKWKSKIDKKEARKNNDKGVKSEKIPENGISHLQKMGSGKLEDNWLFDSPGDTAFDGQPFIFNEEKNPNGAVDQPLEMPGGPFAQSFEQQTEMPVGSETAFADEGEPVPLFPVESETTVEASHTFDQPLPQNPEPTMYAYPPGTEETEWMNSGQQTMQEAIDDEPVDFDTWGNPEENELLAQTLQSQQQNPEAVETADAQPTLEDAYAETDYPGAIRDSDDPYDTAWLMRSGGTDPDQCYAITVYMYQTYHDTWRSWHKDDPRWDAFWSWYYDAGYDVVHSVQHSFPQSYDQDIHTICTEEATGFFDRALEQEAGFQRLDHQMNGETPQDDTQESLSPVSPHLETVPEEPEEFNNEEAISEQFAAMSDDEIWKLPEEEQQEQFDQQLDTASPVPEVMAEDAMSPQIFNQEPLISCPVSAGKESATKLPPWEDEFLFSLPDPFVDSPSSEDGTDDGRLPFAIFNHDGMLQFLMKLKSFLTELSENNHAEMPSAAAHLQRQITELMRAVELSGQNSSKPVVFEEIDILKHELEMKTREIESLRSRLSQEEAVWNNKLDNARQEAIQMQEAFSSMETSLQDQEGRMHELVTKLNQTESELTSNKQQLADLVCQLEAKDDQMRELMGKLADGKVVEETLRDQEETNDGIPAEMSKEMQNLRQELQSLQSKLAEQSDPSLSGADADATLQSELQERVLSLQKELLQQQAALDEKEEELEQLRTASEGNGFSVNNNETGDFLEKLREMEAEIDTTKQLLQFKDSKIAELQKDLQLKSRELEALAFVGVQSTEKDSDSDLASELEIMERKFSRLEQDLHDKDADFQRLSIMLESLQKKDAIISKLTAILSEKDKELLQARTLVEEGRQRETDLIDAIAAKDIDLENVVRSLLFSQKQVSSLCGYCNELGGDAHHLLSTLQVVE